MVQELLHVWQLKERCVIIWVEVLGGEDVGCLAFLHLAENVECFIDFVAHPVGVSSPGKVVVISEESFVGKLCEQPSAGESA